MKSSKKSLLFNVLTVSTWSILVGSIIFCGGSTMAQTDQKSESTTGESPTVTIQRLQDEKASLVKQSAELSASIANLSAANATLIAAQANTSTRAETIEHASDETTTRNGFMATAALQQKNAITKFTKKMMTRLIRSSTRRIAAIGGEAIPYLGIPVLLSMATLDAKDSCDSVKEINELNKELGGEISGENEICSITVPTKDQVMESLRTNWRQSYKVAAESVNQFGARIPSIPPVVSWKEALPLMKSMVGHLPKPSEYFQ
jgi:hypothetical protein